MGSGLRRPAPPSRSRAKPFPVCEHCERTGRTRDRAAASPAEGSDAAAARIAAATRSPPWYWHGPRRTHRRPRPGRIRLDHGRLSCGRSRNQGAWRPCYTRQYRRSSLWRRSSRAIAYEKSGRWFTAEEPFLRAKERTDAGSSAFRHPRSELIAPLPQEVEPAFNNRKLHMRLPWHFPPEQEGYLAYAVIIPTLIFIGHSCRRLSGASGK